MACDEYYNSNKEFKEMVIDAASVRSKPQQPEPYLYWD
jgi:hypothetical protein